MLVNILGKTICVRFGRIASLSTFVLFAGVALSELPMNLSLIAVCLKFFVFRMANSNFPASLRLQYHLISTFVKGDSLSPLTIPLRRAEPARPQSPAACNFAILLHHWLYFYGTEFCRSVNVASCPAAFFA